MYLLKVIAYAGNYVIFKDLIQTVGLLYKFFCMFWRYKKRALKMKKRRKKLPPTINLKKKSRKSTNKNIWP